MVEQSYFWDGTALGDATLAPYDETEFGAAYRHSLGQSFVIGDYLNILEVKTTNTNDASVTVGTGAAYVFGWLYENTSILTFVIAAQGGGNNRIDLLTLQYDSVNQTVRAVVVAGVAAANPTLPATPANALALGYVYVPNGFGAGSTVARNTVHDLRIINSPAIGNHRYVEQPNLIPNAEYLAYPVPASVPTRWQLLAGTAAAQVANITSTPRGSSVEVTIGGANQGIFINLPTPQQDQDKGNSTVYTLVGVIKVTAGQSVPIINIQRMYSTGVFETVASQQFSRTGTYFYFIRFTIDNIDYAAFTTTNPVDLIRITFTGTNGTFTVGQLRLTKGYTYTRHREEHELIMFESALTDAAWNDTAKANGYTTINLAATFGGVISRSVRGIIFRLRARDSGSAGAAGGCFVTVYPRTPVVGGAEDGYVEIRGVTNDIPREVLGITTTDGSVTPSFTLFIGGTGVNTMKVTLQIVGILT